MGQRPSIHPNELPNQIPPQNKYYVKFWDWVVGYNVSSEINSKDDTNKNKCTSTT
jgi:hypothetical protein